jgi:hypothetical protein
MNKKTNNEVSQTSILQSTNSLGLKPVIVSSVIPGKLKPKKENGRIRRAPFSEAFDGRAARGNSGQFSPVERKHPSVRRLNEGDFLNEGG